MRKFFQKRDLFLILPAFALALILLFWTTAASGTCTAIVEQDGRELMRIDLSAVTQPETIDLGGEYHISLLASPGSIRFVASDCPDQICVRTGELSRPGQSAVCLPARVSVRLEGQQKDYDGYTG